jgi:hypothetical protein
MKIPSPLEEPLQALVRNIMRTIEGLVLFRLCIPGGWPAATWTKRMLWYGGLFCLCGLTGFFICISKDGQSRFKALIVVQRHIVDGGGTT